jgi:hypothetical protein
LAVEEEGGDGGVFSEGGWRTAGGRGGMRLDWSEVDTLVVGGVVFIIKILYINGIPR